MTSEEDASGQPLSIEQRTQFVETLEQWRLRVRVALSAYNESTGRAVAAERIIGVPASVLAAVVATAVFASLSQEPAVVWRVLTGCAALVSAALTGLQTFLRLAERAEQYREAARKYGAVRRRIERSLLFLPTTEEAAQLLLAEINEELDEIARGNPNAPQFAWDEAELRVRGVSRARGIRALRLWIRETTSLNIRSQK